jgi:hypothetical protein
MGGGRYANVASSASGVDKQTVFGSVEGTRMQFRRMGVDVRDAVVVVAAGCRYEVASMDG